MNNFSQHSGVQRSPSIAPAFNGSIVDLIETGLASCALIAGEDFFEVGHPESKASGGPDHQSVTPGAWKTYNFEVEEHHTYIADGVRVHNSSKLVKADPKIDGISIFHQQHNGNVDVFIDAKGNPVSTPTQGYYPIEYITNYASIEQTPHGLVARGGFFTDLRALADLLGLDGKFGIQGSFARPGEGLRQRFNLEADKKELFSGKTHDGFGKDGYDKDGYDKGGYDKGGKKTKPIVLDLDGNGISITELSQSQHYVDGGDGLLHRTAWAAAGDGVLFFDVDGDGQIKEKREYVFTEWDPTSASDLDALRAA